MARMVDEQRHRSEWHCSKVVVGLLVLIGLSACQRTSTFPDDAAVLSSWRAALPKDRRVRALVLDPSVSLPHLDPRATLMIVDQNWRVPDASTSERHRKALREFVAAGGQLILFGHATRMVHDLEIEAERPECSVYRWGFDRRAVQGEAELTMHVISGHEPELFEGLAGTVSEQSFPITGGTPCTVPLCSWRLGNAQSGQVLARLGEVLDGEPAPLGPPVLLRWKVGKGHVLACGLLPDLQHERQVVRDNARQFVAGCADWAQRHGSDELLLLEAPDRSPREVAVDRLGPPMVPWLAHWGWQVALYDGDEIDAVRPPDELVRDALLPGWMHGADVIELSLTDAQHGAPLSWPESDPIEPPITFRGASLGGAWASGGFRSFADEAHTRGMLIFGGMDPLPVGDRPAERLVLLRKHARELMGLRRHGASAWDGFGLRQWWPDPQGLGLAMVQDYQPSAALYCVGERVPELAGSLRAVDADDGALRGLSLAGIADGWRAGFPFDIYPVGVLDARAIGDRFPGVGVRGGGSYGDWIVRQSNEFVRERRLRGGTAWWRRHDPRNLGPDTESYVQGVGLEPLRAAVATPLSATGRNGIRAAARDLVENAPGAFGNEVDAPAAAHVLQNNWFRLLGSGGALAFDPRGLARFDDLAMTISPGFCSTRLFGGRPDASEIKTERINLLERGHRGEGDFGKYVRIAIGEPGDLRLPALLAVDQAPQWPAGVVFEWQPSHGYHELRAQLRCQNGGGIVGIFLDDTLLHCVACKGDGRLPELVVPVHIAKQGTRSLRIELLEGHTVAIDRLQLHRAGDIGVEAEVVVPAGSMAQLLERSTSSYHAERVTLTAMADVAGFVMQTHCDQAARNLQVERRLSLPGYTKVTATSKGDDPNGRRMPFVLTSTDASMPDICVVPLQLSRYERLVLEGSTVIWKGAPEAGLTNRVGFLFWPHGRGHESLPHLPRLLEGIDRPLPVVLGRDGRMDITSDLPIAQSRLLHVQTDVTTPFMVRERGYWTMRGSQPAPDGGVWLRVHQEPGDVVRILAGPVVFARTRPGPGSLRVLAMQDPTPRAVVVTVLQPSRLRAPSVVMSVDFDEVTVDGKPWSWFDGRTIYLPDVPGTYKIETSFVRGRLAQQANPHVRSTAAPLMTCAFDASTNELVFETGTSHNRPAGLPWTAVLTGPVPVTIENGEIVDAASLQLPDAAAQAAAARGGVLIRFRSGRTTVRYPGWNAVAGR